MTMGNVYAILGAALAVILSGIGSAIGVSRSGQALSGLLSKDPNQFGKNLVLQVIPASQGLYGFVVGFIVLVSPLKLMSSEINMLTDVQGLSILMFCMPVAIVGLFSAILQGNVIVAGIALNGKQENQFIRVVIMAVMVEIFALFAFIISILGVLQA